MPSQGFRLEPEFYTAKSFKMNEHYRGEDITDFVQYGTSKELNEEFNGYPILRLNEFDSIFISQPAKYCSLIDEKVYNSLKLKMNDVLICRTNGNPNLVGKSAIVPTDYEYAYASYLFKVRTKIDKINASTLVAYLNSKFGRLEIEKYSMASNQVNFSPAKFKQIRIPSFNKRFNDLVEKLTYLSFSLLEKSKNKYLNVEKRLLEELGWDSVKDEFSNYRVKNFQDSFKNFQRLDAEFFQLKYERVSKLIENYPEGSGTIAKNININKTNYNPKNQKKYKYIELSNIGKTGDIQGYTEDFGSNLPSRARRLVKVGDVIISSIEGSLSSCALITEEYDGSLCSTGFFVISSEKINSETLLVLFKSKMMQKLLKQSCSGTILTSLNLFDFNKIPIPFIKQSLQQEICADVRTSFKLKNQSKLILKKIDEAIEIYILKDESKAFNYLREVKFEGEE